VSLDSAPPWPSQPPTTAGFFGSQGCVTPRRDAEPFPSLGSQGVRLHRLCIQSNDRCRDPQMPRPARMPEPGVQCSGTQTRMFSLDATLVLDGLAQPIPAIRIWRARCHRRTGESLPRVPADPCRGAKAARSQKPGGFFLGCGPYFSSMSLRPRPAQSLDPVSANSPTTPRLYFLGAAEYPLTIIRHNNSEKPGNTLLPRVLVGW